MESSFVWEGQNVTLSHHKRQPNLDTKSLFRTWKRNVGCYMWWLIFFFSGHKIPFPLGNSPGSCRGIFLFPLLLLPRIVFKSSMCYEENCNINTSSGHLYPSHKKKRQRTWTRILFFPVTSSLVIAFFQHSTYLTSTQKDAKAIIRHSWPWIQKKQCSLTT